MAWARTLATAASTSPLHALAIRRALEIAIGAGSGRPNGFDKILQLLLELSVEKIERQRATNADLDRTLQQMILHFS